MVAPTTIGLNFTKISDYNLSIDVPSTISEVTNRIITTASTTTDGKYSYVILGVMWLILFWVLNDKSPLAEYRYASSRSSLIAFCVCAVMGFTLLEAGFISSFRVVALLTVIYILNYIFIEVYENKE